MYDYQELRLELKEELGIQIDVICKIGVVSDYYNLIHRHNINNYFLCQINTFGEKKVPRKLNLPDIKDMLINNGYICMMQSTDRISFNKGYTENGFAEKVFHLYLRYMGDNDELYFRDYLNDFPNTASQYEKMKLNLWEKYKYNRDSYTKAKSDFVKKYTSEAKSVYGNRY